MNSKDLQDVEHLIDCACDALVEAKARLRLGKRSDGPLRIAAGCCSTAFGIADAAIGLKGEAK